MADNEPGVGLIGVLVESGIPVYVAQSYSQKLTAKGPVIIMVHTTTGNEDKIITLFKRFSGQDIFSQLDLLNTCS